MNTIDIFDMIEDAIHDRREKHCLALSVVPLKPTYLKKFQLTSLKGSKFSQRVDVRLVCVDLAGRSFKSIRKHCRIGSVSDDMILETLDSLFSSTPLHHPTGIKWNTPVQQMSKYLQDTGS